MMKYAAMLLLVIRLSYQPGAVEAESKTLREPATVAVIPAGPATIRIEGAVRHDKVMLNWEVKKNEATDLFEVEKSRDGIHYSMVGLVFGTDKKKTEQYRFFEKADEGIMRYRVKLVDKKKQAAYSGIVELNTGLATL